MRCTLRLVLVASALLFATLTHAADGLVAIKSSHDVKATADKLESVLKEKGMTVMARVNHQQGAEKPGWRCVRPKWLFSATPKSARH